jgi:hypothetical protein
VLNVRIQGDRLRSALPRSIGILNVEVNLWRGAGGTSGRNFNINTGRAALRLYVQKYGTHIWCFYGCENVDSGLLDYDVVLSFRWLTLFWGNVSSSSSRCNGGDTLFQNTDNYLHDYKVS